MPELTCDDDAARAPEEPLLGGTETTLRRVPRITFAQSLSPRAVTPAAAGAMSPERARPADATEGQGRASQSHVAGPRPFVPPPHVRGVHRKPDRPPRIADTQRIGGTRGHLGGTQTRAPRTRGALGSWTPPVNKRHHRAISGVLRPLRPVQTWTEREWVPASFTTGDGEVAVWPVCARRAACNSGTPRFLGRHAHIAAAAGAAAGPGRSPKAAHLIHTVLFG